MPVCESMLASGNWLFRRRSWLPVIALLLVAVELYRYDWIDGSHRASDLWELGCLLIGLAGIGIRLYVVGHAPAHTSGRVTGGQVAAELNTTGPYSIVRHPLYVGNYLMWMSVVLFLHDWQLAMIISLIYWLYYERIMVAEEHFLRERFGAAWETWARQTPTFVPDPRRWRPPGLPFSFRSAIRGEYAGFLGLVALLSLLDAGAGWLVSGQLRLGTGYLVLLTVATVLYVVLRTLRRHTRVLEVPGR